MDNKISYYVTLSCLQCRETIKKVSPSYIKRDDALKFKDMHKSEYRANCIRCGNTLSLTVMAKIILC